MFVYIVCKVESDTDIYNCEPEEVFENYDRAVMYVKKRGFDKQYTVTDHAYGIWHDGYSTNEWYTIFERELHS
jgi:hypothetical protein